VEFGPADLTPPVIKAEVTGTLGNAGWYVSDVSISWDVSDPESDVTNATGCSSVAVTQDTSGATFTCTATSAGGTASETVEVRRDATAPEAAFYGVQERYTVDQRVEIGCTAVDALSGLVASSCPTMDVDAYTLELGEHHMEAFARDTAGNETWVEVRYNVAVTYGSLCTLVERFTTGQGTARSLCQTLASAESAEDRGQARAKENQIRAFTTQVRANSGRNLSADNAEVLVRLAGGL
jgi:hypothetical protein